MARAVIYARFSSERQRDESIEDQVRVCTEEAERNGDRVVRVYADRAASGTTTERRAAFAEMIADSASGDWERVYVYKTDRFARNRYDSAIYKTKLKRNGVRVVSATERIEDGPDGILLEAVLEGMAEYYSVNLAQNVRRGLHGNALKCRHNGVHVYGYDKADDGGYRVNEHEAEAVRTAFDMYDGGSTVPEIVDALRPWRSPGGKSITMQMLSRLLRNEKYAGVYSYAGVRVEGGMPAIVSREQFDRVQARLAAGRRRRTVSDYLLSGRLYDPDGNHYQGYCGYGKAGAKYTYYRCLATGSLIRQDALEAAVAEQVRAFLASDHVAETIADLVMEEQEEALADDLAAMEALRGRIADNEREQGRMVDLAARVGATDAIARKLGELADERASAEAELAEMERGVPVLDRERVEFWVREIVGRGDPLEVMAMFVSRVVVDPGTGELRVEFVVGGGYAGPPDGGPGGPSGGEGAFDKAIDAPTSDFLPGNCRPGHFAVGWFRMRLGFWGHCAPAASAR